MRTNNKPEPRQKKKQKKQEWLDKINAPIGGKNLPKKETSKPKSSSPKIKIESSGLKRFLKTVKKSDVAETMISLKTMNRKLKRLEAEFLKDMEELDIVHTETLKKVVRSIIQIFTSKNKKEIARITEIFKTW